MAASLRSTSTSGGGKGRSKKNGWECPYCSVTFPEDTKSLQCDTCQGWVCLPCTKVPEDIYDMMDKFNGDKKGGGTRGVGIKWICKLDERSLPTLKEMNSTLSSIMKTNNERFDKIEEQVKKVEGSIGEKVSEEVTNLKAGLMAEISDEIDKKLEQKLKEENDRRYREMNLCFFNVPVCKDGDGYVRKQHDIDIVNKLYQAVVKDEDGKELLIKNVYRAKGTNESTGEVPEDGVAQSDFCPVLKVTFVHKSDRRLLLTNSRHIKGNLSLEAKLRKIFVSPDLYPKQREESKKLRKELLEKNKDGNLFTIRNGKIVPKQSANPAGAGDDSDSPSD